MPSGDPPNNNWANPQYGHIYVGDPIHPNGLDTGGNPPWHQQMQQQYGGLVQQPSQLILGGLQASPFTVTYVEPKDGDIRWNIAGDCAEIYEGKSHSWIPILTAAVLKEIYGEVQKALKSTDTFADRFRDVICEAEGIEFESAEERKQKEYVEEMVARVKHVVTEALRKWAEQQQKIQNEYQPNVIYSTSTGYLSGGPT